MKIKDIFERDPSRDIAPVVYFHQQAPERVQDEVAEYIVTGGYADDDPRRRRVASGIHEQLVRLLNGIAGDLRKKSGADLPACWISGFYGSGKSSFAKLLGLALDGLVLPGGQPLDQALLARDDSPRAAELHAAWHGLRDHLDPIAVVFDIGSVARDREDIHTAARRQLQRRLGYCPVAEQVAEYELALERRGDYARFEAAVEEVHGQLWHDLKADPVADELFSEVMHHLWPDRYLDPLSWFDARAGSTSAARTAVDDVVLDITEMMDRRAPGKTLFFVVDEVSQYVHQNDNRMLALQSFVADLGQKLHGRVWLLATGQQKLEDDDATSSIGKLKDRFPSHLRVHLAATNIRDVVHKRLLQKSPQHAHALRELFEAHKQRLRLYAWGCADITDEDFVEVYPLLPGHIDLLMEITSALRVRSTRAQGDAQAIRGLLQLVGELFREQDLGDLELGALVSLDRVFDLQRTALDTDVQSTLERLFAHRDVLDRPLAARVAKAVALLELIQERVPTTEDTVARCLCDHLGADSLVDAVKEQLQLLRAHGFLSWSEASGYKVMSSAGVEWQRERDGFPVTFDDQSKLIAELLEKDLARVDRPRFKGKPFGWFGLYHDNRLLIDHRLTRATDSAVVTVEFLLRLDETEHAPGAMIARSAEEARRNRLLWVNGQASNTFEVLRELARSRHMVSRHEGRVAALPLPRQRLYFEEAARRDALQANAEKKVRGLFEEGVIYFRGRSIPVGGRGGFATALARIGDEILPELYLHFVEIAVTEAELKQLLQRDLSGVSSKFLDNALGLLTYEAGRYTATCTGTAPSRIFRTIERERAVTGAALLAEFAGPPSGYAPDVTRACVAGLVLARKIAIQPESGPTITSLLDPGAQDLLLRARDFNRARLHLAENDGLTPRELARVQKFFVDAFAVEIERGEDAIADAAFQRLPAIRGRVQALKDLLLRLPRPAALPQPLARLADAVEACTLTRHITPTARAVLNHLDALRDGLNALTATEATLTPDALDHLKTASDLLLAHAAQLEDTQDDPPVRTAIATLRAHLDHPTPWLDTPHLLAPMDDLRVHYQNVRADLIEKHDQHYHRVIDALQRDPHVKALPPEKAELVLRIIRRAAYDTSRLDLAPALAQIRDLGPVRLHHADIDARRKADEIFAAAHEGPAPQTSIELTSGLRGRILTSPAELDLLLEDLRKRILAALERGGRVRLVE